MASSYVLQTMIVGRLGFAYKVSLSAKLVSRKFIGGGWYIECNNETF